MNQNEGGCVICRPAARKYRIGDTFGFTLMSDLHIGAADADYSLIKSELETAKRNGDRIAINGDVFDLILPKDAKRYTPGALHKRVSGRSDVINAALEWAAEILAPYAPLIDMIGVGNHETSVEKYHSADLVMMLIDKLAPHAKENQIHHGGYTGFIDYRFHRGEGTAKGDGRRFVVWYHHGAGGASPVTKGTIDFHRKGWVRADVKWIGHKHNRFALHEVEMSCPERGDAPTMRDVRNIMTGSYFRTYHGQTQQSIKANGRKASYAADAGLAPQGCGGARVVVTMLRDGNRVQVVQ